MNVIEYEINEEVQEMLRQLPGPIGVVSVAGMYRTGKSYLLNRMLLNRSGGFGVGPTINPCTKVFKATLLTFIGPLDLGQARPRFHAGGRPNKCANRRHRGPRCP